MGEGPQELKVSGAVERGGLDIFPIYEEGGLAKKERVSSLPHFGRPGACHDITKSADSQININFSENDCIIAESLQKPLSNQ